VADPVAPEALDVTGEPEPGDELAPAVVAPTGSGPTKPVKRYGKRFLVLYLILGALLGVAVAGLAVVLTRPSEPEGPAWSVWAPTGEDAAGVTQEIAGHVSATYRLPSGQQLVGIQVAPPRVQDLPLGAIAVRHVPTGADAANPVNVFPVDGVTVYIMCGLGENCSIDEGEPSAERLRLLRREALELALYTFRYVDETDSVVTFLPPRPGAEPSFALLFERGELGAQLDRPLRATLPNSPPPVVPENIAPIEVRTIDRLTASNFYRFSFQQLQDGTAVLVLDDPRLPEQTPTTTDSGSSTGTQDGSTGTQDGGATTGSGTEAGAQGS
jgi:hypothetical protein